MTRHIFHLSLPVSELDSAQRFYVEVLGASKGRENQEWVDILLWGHQITLQLQPHDVSPAKHQDKRHFGVVLPWQHWEQEAQRIKSMGVAFLKEPTVLKGGTPDEQAKFYLQDPSHNVIEVKAYRNVRATLGLEHE